MLNCFLNLVDNDRHAEEFSWLLTLLWKSVRVYTEMKASFMLYKVVLLTLSVDRCSSVTIQMKATEQYFSVLLFLVLYKVVQTFESRGNPMV